MTLVRRLLSQILRPKQMSVQSWNCPCSHVSTRHSTFGVEEQYILEYIDREKESNVELLELTTFGTASPIALEVPANGHMLLLETASVAQQAHKTAGEEREAADLSETSVHSSDHPNYQLGSWTSPPPFVSWIDCGGVAIRQRLQLVEPQLRHQCRRQHR